jgi:capsular polysaccharide biosynthesis protein
MDGATKRKIRRPISFVAKRINGAVLSLGSRYTDNHFHFLLEHLPLILLAREHIGHKAKLNILITPKQAWWQTEYLVRLGEKPEHIIELNEGTIQCGDVWITPNIDLIDRKLPYEANLYREIALRFKKGITPKRKNRSLFITRNDAPRRRLQNEDDVFAELQKTHPNIERVSLSRISLQEQITLFSETNFVVVPAGQASRNILFCENTLWIELMPGHRNQMNIYHVWAPTVTHLGEIHGNRYLSLYTEENYPQDESNWIFPIEKLKSALERLQLLGEITQAIQK